MNTSDACGNNSHRRNTDAFMLSISAIKRRKGFVRGSQKKVIHLKNTGSSLFSEAYFIVSPEGEQSGREISDMLCEADRIIDQSLNHECARRERGRKFLGFLIPFFLGVLMTLSGAVLSAVLI